MERELHDLEEKSERAEKHIRESREDWERKEEDPGVLGAQPAESDQLPEEGPREQVLDDTGGPTRRDSENRPGAEGDEGTATGNPDAAGSDEPGPED